MPTSNDTRVRVEALLEDHAERAPGAQRVRLARLLRRLERQPERRAGRPARRARGRGRAGNPARRAREAAPAAVLHDHSQERKSIRGQVTRLRRVHPAGASSESLDDALAAALARHLTPAELCDITCALLHRRLAVPVAVWVPRDGGVALCAQRGPRLDRRAPRARRRLGARRAARGERRRRAARRRRRAPRRTRPRCAAPPRCSATRSAASRPRRASRPAAAGSGRPSRGSPRRASTAPC